MSLTSGNSLAIAIVEGMFVEALPPACLWQVRRSAQAPLQHVATHRRELSTLARTILFPPHSENADKKTGEDTLKPQRDKGRTRHDEPHGVGVIQMAEPGRPPLPNRSKE